MDYMAPWDDDENGDGGIAGMGGDGDLANLLVKLTDNALSGAMFERRAAARGVLEAFKQSCFAEEDTMNVIAVIEQLVNDQEQLVRQEITEQLPEIAIFCHEEGPYLDFVVPQHILPHIVKLITDKFSQVRKSAQTGLLSLLEKGIIAPSQVAEQVCPVIIEYTEPNVMDDYRTEVTGFMSKLARFVWSKEIVVNMFLERFCSLCRDPMFQVRRVCASSMGDIANVIGTRLTEAVLLPEFLALCKDDVWGVRKGCAEIFTDIARLCQLSTRRQKLTPAFVKLLEDSTRWVKVAAYQSLGPFITTFSVEADSPVEIPELTEFEKNFIEKLKDSPTNAGFENRSNLRSQHHRSTMLGSESTEDLTSICIQDDDVKIDDDYFYHDSPEEKGKEDTGDEEKDEVSNRSSKQDQGMNEYSIYSRFRVNSTLSTDYKKEPPLPSAYEMDFDKTNKLIVFGENTRSFEKEADKGERGENNLELDNNQSCSSSNTSDNTSSVSPVVTVHTSTDEPGVHIRIEKEAPQEISQICRSSSVLTHRPSSISGGVSHSLSSSNPCLGQSKPTASSNVSNESTTTFNTFQYWRIPLPDIELDIGMVEGKPTSVHVRAKVEDPNLKLTYASEISVNLSSDTLTKTGTVESGGAGDATSICTDSQPKVENLQIQTISSSQICDNESELATKMESSLSNTTVSLVDGRVAEVHKSYMDLYNVTSSPGGAAGTCKETNVFIANNGNVEGGGILGDFALDMTHLEAFDDDSDDQLSVVANYGFGEEQKKTRLLPELPKSSIGIKQDVLPDVLLDHFIGMSQDSDPELAPCCVFNLPAVVLTLGPQHWSVLRDCYENLASSLQWKVRYTLAACLHEIANILGPELSERDLVPFYNALMMDLDEVRIGVLKHLACFFKILGGEERKKCLKTIKAFIKTDNPRNWRFRLELVYQIEQLVDMFEMDDVYRHVCPVCIDLIKDKVAEIRKESLQAVTYVVRRLNECHAAMNGAGNPNVVHEFLVELVKSLSKSTQWVRRQTFAALAGQLVATNALNPSQFAQDILPHLIGLSEDKVPNVRLVVARSIVSSVLQQDCFNDPLNPHRSLMMETLEMLQKDVDPDVRFHSRKQPLDEEEEQLQDIEEPLKEVAIAEKL